MELVWCIYFSAGGDSQACELLPTQQQFQPSPELVISVTTTHGLLQDVLTII